MRPQCRSCRFFYAGMAEPATVERGECQDPAKRVYSDKTSMAEMNSAPEVSAEWWCPSWFLGDPVAAVEFVPVDEVGSVRGRVFYGPSPFAAASAAELLGRSVVVNGAIFDVAGVERQAKLPASIAIGEPIGLLLRPSR